MQNYMITKRRQTGMTPSETAEDQAAKNFRSIVEKNGRKYANKAAQMGDSSNYSYNCCGARDGSNTF